MSFETIEIRRRVPIIAGQVQVPDKGTYQRHLMLDEVLSISDTSLLKFGQNGLLDAVEFTSHLAQSSPVSDHHQDLRDESQAQVDAGTPVASSTDNDLLGNSVVEILGVEAGSIS
jgi:hypothetical protein